MMQVGVAVGVRVALAVAVRVAVKVAVRVAVRVGEPQTPFGHWVGVGEAQSTPGWQVGVGVPCAGCWPAGAACTCSWASVAPARPPIASSAKSPQPRIKQRRLFMSYFPFLILFAAYPEPSR